MTVPTQLCVLLLFGLCSSVISQGQERMWHSTTTPAPYSTTTATPSTTTTMPPTVESTTTGPPTVSDDNVETNTEASVDAAADVDDDEEDVSPDSYDEFDEEPPVEDESALVEEKEETAPLDKNDTKKDRKWMSVLPEELEAVQNSTVEEETFEEDPVIDSSETLVNNTSEANEEIVPAVDETEVNLTENIPLEMIEIIVPYVHKTIVSKKTTTVYMAFADSFENSEPTFVNLTGIREFTGRERRIVSGCLDLSDLYITGEEASEVVSRMARHKYHRLDLSGNNIKELPPNTFTPVAFTVRELNLQRNPLASNTRGEGSMLQRGGLFHLTELRDLNLSGCGLEDMDFFTPWNSNHLEVMDLSNNRLREIPSNLQFFHQLRRLYLDGNPIIKIAELPFALLWNLQTLSISGCHVSSISSDPFRNMEHLKEISLAGNNLTRVREFRLPRGSSVRMYLTSNPWHCDCDMLSFVERYHYAIRDIEDIRCASPRWLEGLRTAYLTKEILSLDSIDGDCSPPRYDVTLPVPVTPMVESYTSLKTERLELLTFAAFALAAIIMIIHVLCSRKKEKFKLRDDRDEIKYIRIDRKPSFK